MLYSGDRSVEDYTSFKREVPLPQADYDRAPDALRKGDDGIPDESIPSYDPQKPPHYDRGNIKEYRPDMRAHNDAEDGYKKRDYVPDRSRGRGMDSNYDGRRPQHGMQRPHQPWNQQSFPMESRFYTRDFLTFPFYHIFLFFRGPNRYPDTGGRYSGQNQYQQPYGSRPSYQQQGFRQHEPQQQQRSYPQNARTQDYDKDPGDGGAAGEETKWGRGSNSPPAGKRFRSYPNDGGVGSGPGNWDVSGNSRDRNRREEDVGRSQAAPSGGQGIRAGYESGPPRGAPAYGGNIIVITWDKLIE